MRWSHAGTVRITIAKTGRLALLRAAHENGTTGPEDEPSSGQFHERSGPTRTP